MAIKTSTGLRNGLLAGTGIKEALDAGFIKIYGGTIPETADAALGSATLLCTISVDGEGSGLSFDTAATGGVITKDPTEVWEGDVVADGTATFYRFVAAADDGTASSTAPRIQGTVGAVGADMNLADANLVTAQTRTIDSYALAMPTL